MESKSGDELSPPLFLWERKIRRFCDDYLMLIWFTYSIAPLQAGAR